MTGAKYNFKILFIFSTHHSCHDTELLLTPREADLIFILAEITELYYMSLEIWCQRSHPLNHHLHHGAWCLHLINSPKTMPSLKSIPKIHFFSHCSLLSYSESFHSSNVLSEIKVRLLVLWLASLPWRIPILSSYPVPLQMCKSKSWWWCSTFFFFLLNCQHTPGHKKLFL